MGGRTLLHSKPVGSHDGLYAVLMCFPRPLTAVWRRDKRVAGMKQETNWGMSQESRKEIMVA